MREEALERALEGYRGALRLHCYRMLGSSHDSEDLVQETMLRAWRARETLADPSRLRGWVFRIATNACLDELAQRPRRVLASELRAAQDPATPPEAGIDEALWLEPMPDAWLVGAGAGDPEARYGLRESVALAFVAALQVLTVRERAALLLRDVVGMSAEETAEAIGQTVSAVNSALHRARVAVEERTVRGGAAAAAPDAAVLERYVRAIAEADVEAMVALLHEEVHTTMPPSPTWIEGRAANEVFYRRMFAAWAPGDARVVPVGANGGRGFVFWRDGVARAVEVVEVRDGAIWRMHHFMQPAVVRVFGG